ncbi:EcoKI restriction-modification system protein HsdS [Symmachiella dynata]|uniref:restriction endonuclease subunit S n=1 Tax=Symmachiella dynata TaxID=2527995 RepID=UPI00118876F9|nr:restriction endonuclease subunit S [Symmachiella dynata]QDT48917.1 EcoKI restriction-modification system protein HsdS [Symmachiella dynata]
MTTSRKMKDSGVEWIGEIPVHWKVKKLKHWVRFLNHRRIPISSQDRAELSKDFPYYGASGIIDYVDRYIFDEPLILIGEDGANLLSRSTSLAFIATGKYWVNNHAHILKPLSGNLTFWAGRLEEMSYVPFVTGSAQPKLTIENLSNIEFAAPAPDEQEKIAAFLDRKTAQIDVLIAKKQRLIELLGEKRQALISHAVTKGLDPHVPMKDSGVEWLGEIPAHWTVKRLKHISPRIGVGLVINPSTYTTDDGVPFLFGGDIQPGRILTEKARRMTDENSRKLPQSRLHAGDLVTVRVGYPGVTAVVPPELEGANCASVMVVRGASRFISQWLCYAMNSPLGSDQINVVKYGAAQEQFNIGHAIEFVFPVPPKEEQQRIADLLDEQVNRISGIASRVQEQIAKMQEYRQTLISAAVTGKIDVTTEAVC